MTEREALQLALRALDEIDKLADRAANGGADGADAVELIHGITGEVIGDLARAGHEAEVAS